MPDPSPTKLTITAYSDTNFNTTVGDPFAVWVNPGSYTHTTQIGYSDRQAQGSGGMSPEFNRVISETVSFELLFDATGVIPLGKGQSYANGVSDAIKQLTTLTATMNGDIHSPNYLILNWAQLTFQCVLESLTINYTLFRPDGTPIRAKVQTSFQSYTNEQQLAKIERKNSPDMTHLVQVRTGDTLPLLCYQVYGDSRYYFEVARINQLTNFRSLIPGTQLVFPPLDGAKS